MSNDKSIINNTEVLRGVFNNGIERRIIEKWYETDLRTHLWYINQSTGRMWLHTPPSKWDKETHRMSPDVCVLHLEEEIPKSLTHSNMVVTEQHGGKKGDQLYHYHYQGVDYCTKISYLTGTDANGDFIAEFYLMSPLNTNNVKHCVWVTIDRQSPTVADVSDVNKQYQCSDPTNPPIAGRIYIYMMLNFLTDHKDQLGIQYVELSDVSSYPCPEVPNVSVVLEQSRQLEGKYPYYVQFGFRPKLRENIQILKTNRQTMLHLCTSDVMTEDFLMEYGCPRKIKEYIDTHQEHSLMDTVKYISRINCSYYGWICSKLFKQAGLKELDEPIYVKRL